MEDIDTIVERVVEAMKEYDFETFHIGATVPNAWLEHEDSLRSEFRLRGKESLKGDLTRRIGASVAQKLRKRVTYRSPDVVALVELESRRIKISSRPLHLFGRYIKEKRGLPQKSLKCDECHGKGCPKCGFTGFSNKLSVEKILSDHILKYLGGTKVTFTWIGGEDSNSLVMGNGRPYYADVHAPKKYT